MSRQVKLFLEMVHDYPERYKVSYVLQRPFILAGVYDAETAKQGIGFACCQLPDLWDVTKGKQTALARAVKHLLGIPNPHLSEYVLAQTVKEEVPF